MLESVSSTALGDRAELGKDADDDVLGTMPKSDCRTLPRIPGSTPYGRGFAPGKVADKGGHSVHFVARDEKQAADRHWMGTAKGALVFCADEARGGAVNEASWNGGFAARRVPTATRARANAYQAPLRLSAPVGRACSSRRMTLARGSTFSEWTCLQLRSAHRAEPTSTGSADGAGRC